MPHLRTLSLFNCPRVTVGAALVATLETSCPKLAPLDFIGCGITDSALVNLSTVLGGLLCRITLRHCSGVSDDDVATVVTAVLLDASGTGDEQTQLTWQRALAAGRHVRVDISTPNASTRFREGYMVFDSYS